MNANVARAFGLSIFCIASMAGCSQGDGAGNANQDNGNHALRCGNGTVDDEEACDGVSFGGATCITQGFDGGELVCVDCQLDLSGCRRCGDGVCSDGETASDCPDDCGVVSVSAGVEYTCAVLADGTARCWGRGDRGQLGDGTSTDYALEPRVVVGLVDIVRLAAKVDVTCAALGSGSAACWGTSELGNGLEEGSSVPVTVSVVSQVTSISVGEFNPCVVDGSQVYCWGFNMDGYTLGVPARIGECPLVPTLVPGTSGAVAVDSFLEHSCTLLDDGHLKCWGLNRNGQLGCGDLDEHQGPVDVLGIDSAVALSVGGYHNCALTAGDEVLCWGINQSGQVGDGTRTDRLTPVLVPGATGATSVAAGVSYTLALLPDGTLLGWGYAGGDALGPGHAEVEPSPVPIAGIEGVTAVAAGYQHACAILEDRTLRCWGENASGQLGDGTQDRSAVPVQPIGL
jgi:alpha-tubulin suppressor-like RCC1 family protein